MKLFNPTEPSPEVKQHINETVQFGYNLFKFGPKAIKQVLGASLTPPIMRTNEQKELMKYHSKLD